MQKKTDYRRRTGAVVLTFVLATTTIAVPVGANPVSDAAAKPQLESAKGTILTGESETVNIKNVKQKQVKKLTVTSTNKSVATAKKSGKTAFVIKSKKAGKATIKATVALKNKKKKYRLNYRATVADVVDRKVTVHTTGNGDSVMKLRFFCEMPHVPYVRVTTYYNELSGNKKLDVKKTADDEYLLTNPFGVTATVNTDTDVLSSDQYDLFAKVYTPDEGEPAGNSDYSGEPYLKPFDDIVLEPAKPITISFADYGLDIKGDTDDIWLPFATASNLFVSYVGATLFCNGTTVFHSMNLSDLSYLYDPTYIRDYNNTFPGGVRPTDITDYTYRELMFLFDTQWGNPGHCYFSEAIREKGMDRALSETDDATRGVQTLLKSNRMADYMLGIGILNDMLFDGGHTNLTYVPDPYEYAADFHPKSWDDFFKRYYGDMNAAADKIGYTLKNTPNMYWNEVDRIIESRGWEKYDYHEQGDTAIYTFNQFEADIDAWNEYYKNGGDFPDDTYGNFIKYLNKAKESGNIKNFVLDLTGNRGGDDNVLIAMFDVMIGESNMCFQNTKTGRRTMHPFKADKNLDGKFDEKDDAVKYPFNYAVLTSKYSYSCANLMPFIAKDNGIILIGEHTGGGGCVEIATSSPDGMVNLYSGSIMPERKNGGSMDLGIEPDVAIPVKQDADGNSDYSAFYDIPALSGYINDFYKIK